MTLHLTKDLTKQETKPLTTHPQPHFRASHEAHSIPKVIEGVVIGISTGGPAALQVLLSQISTRVKVPIVIVQHMPLHFTEWLAERLNEVSRLKVKEAEHGEVLKAGTVYLAPGGRHIELKRAKQGGVKVELNDNPPVRSCRPCVDVLFESASRSFRNGVLAVVMTGMGRDGYEGLKTLKQKIPTYCLTQDAKSCVVYGMPKAIAEAQLSDESLPLESLALRINELTSR